MKTFLVVATFASGLSNPHIEAVEMPDTTLLQCQALINQRQPIANQKADCLAGETEDVAVAQFRRAL